MSLEELQAQYKEKIGNLPPNKKNDAEWLLAKLNEPVSEVKQEVVKEKAVESVLV